MAVGRNGGYLAHCFISLRLTQGCTSSLGRLHHCPPKPQQQTHLLPGAAPRSPTHTSCSFPMGTFVPRGLCPPGLPAVSSHPWRPQDPQGLFSGSLAFGPRASQF